MHFGCLIYESFKSQLMREVLGCFHLHGDKSQNSVASELSVLLKKTISHKGSQAQAF